MEFNEIITHPYIKKIEEMCFADEPATKIVNWVKNTVDSDVNIPLDKKKDYYVTVSKINSYKSVLKESARDMIIKLESPSVVTGNMVDASTVEIIPNNRLVTKKILEKHAENGLIKIHTSLSNLAEKIEEQMERFEEYLKSETMIDPDMHKAYRGYINSMTALLKELSEITGYKDFYKKMGENFGEAVSKNALDQETKNKLKSFLHKVLIEIGDVDKIPQYLEQLEEILGEREKK